MEGYKNKISPEFETTSNGTSTETNVTEMNDEAELGQERFHLAHSARFFPDLVWELIAKKLKTVGDIENFSNSGAFFNKLLLAKRKTEVVLPKVFEVLAENYAKSEDKAYKETNVQTILWNRPEGQPVHQMTGLWKCRLVCKSWNMAIENLHQHKDAGHFVNVGNCFKKTKRNPPTKNYHLLKYAQRDLFGKTTEFVKQFTITHYDSSNNCITKNPFLGRSVELMLVNSVTHPGQVELRNSTNELIEKWGREIWYCKIFDYRLGLDTMSDEIEFYRSFRNFLLMMPNLRVLNILYDCIRRKFVSQDFGRLKREIGENPLTKMPNLLNLFSTNLPAPIGKHLISVNSIPAECFTSTMYT